MHLIDIQNTTGMTWLQPVGKYSCLFSDKNRSSSNMAVGSTLSNTKTYHQNLNKSIFCLKWRRTLNVPLNVYICIHTFLSSLLAQCPLLVNVFLPKIQQKLYIFRFSIFSNFHLAWCPRWLVNVWLPKIQKKKYFLIFYSLSFSSGLVPPAGW